MSKVFFKKIETYNKTDEIVKGSKELLEKIIKEENITLGPEVPLKVHFGEKGNVTYIESKN